MRISFIYFVVFFIVKVLFLIFIEKIIYFWSILINKPTKIQIEVCLGVFFFICALHVKDMFHYEVCICFCNSHFKKRGFLKECPAA